MASTTVDAAYQPEAFAAVYERQPLFARIGMYLQIWLMKSVVAASSAVMRTFKMRGMGTIQPTYKKRYPVGPRLENDVYIPSGYKAGTTLPLYLDIHGGGFAIGDPGDDAAWCRYLSEKHHVCVVSLDYRKAPSYQFPQATEDLAEIVTAILQDSSLPVDFSKVCMGGFSAGGNLSLSVAQRPEMQGKFKGLLLWYPVLDLSNKYKGTYRPASDGSPDFLLGLSGVFSYAYVNPGQDCCDPGLSPIYADRKLLPEKMFFMCAEYDVLCHEAECAAELYAKAEGAAVQKQDENDWTAGGIKWRRILDVQHAFNIMSKRDPEVERKRVESTDKAYAEAAAWLKKEIYA